MLNTWFPIYNTQRWLLWVLFHVNNKDGLVSIEFLLIAFINFFNRIYVYINKTIIFLVLLTNHEQSKRGQTLPGQTLHCRSVFHFQWWLLIMNRWSFKIQSEYSEGISFFKVNSYNNNHSIVSFKQMVIYYYWFFSS